MRSTIFTFLLSRCHFKRYTKRRNARNSRKTEPFQFTILSFAQWPPSTTPEPALSPITVRVVGDPTRVRTIYVEKVSYYFKPNPFSDHRYWSITLALRDPTVDIHAG
jgi:hypothetical protein